MNAKVIEALEAIQSNLSDLVDALQETANEAEVKTTVEKTVSKKETKTTEEKTPVKKTSSEKGLSRKEREASEELPDVSGHLDREQLDSLSYNNLKKLAKEMGISATGARDELTDKILSTEVNASAEESEDDSEEVEAPAPKTTKRGRKSKKTEPVEEETPVAEEESEEEESDDSEDDVVARVNEAVEDMSNEEIADLLADVGVKAKGKRQALISAVITAVEEGKIDLDDDDDEDDEDEEDTSAESESESDEEDFDVNDTKNPNMTKERKTALIDYDKDTRASFKKGEISRKEIIAWLNEFNGTKDTMKKKSDAELLDEYIYDSSLLINDEGEMPEEEGAYTVNGVPFCCGHELSYNEDNETYICEVCGAEYEAE